MQVLDNVRVVEWTEAMAGPYCAHATGRLRGQCHQGRTARNGRPIARMGATFRGLRGLLTFWRLNRNKRSLTLNLSHPRGLEIMRALIAQADVFIHNQPKRESLVKRGLDYESLATLNPKLIYCVISGYGWTGPKAGLPGCETSCEEGGVKEYSYAPFHRFEFPFTSVVAEPLVFLHSDTSGVRFFVNPLWMFFELQEKTPGSGFWWDPRRGVDVLVRHVIDDGYQEAVEIRTDYLLKYLQARQMSLLVGHYRHLHLFNPSQSAIGAFVEGDLTLGTSERGAKAILQNWGLQQGLADRAKFLQRRLHLWFEIKPPAIDVDDPWADEPSFDPYAFTLPTSVGLVAPARWKHLRGRGGKTFEGTTCAFMDRVYFRQEVLTKYEGAAGFDIKDYGSVSCRDYWGLTSSTSRIGNELLATSIGDFAEGGAF